MKREGQNINVIWIEPKISKRFLDFIIKNVYSFDHSFQKNAKGRFHFSLEDIQTCVWKNKFKLDPEDENFFELGKEMNIDYVKLFIC